MASIIRHEVEAANRAWLGGLMQSMNNYLYGPNAVPLPVIGDAATHSNAARRREAAAQHELLANNMQANQLTARPDQRLQQVLAQDQSPRVNSLSPVLPAAEPGSSSPRYLEAQGEGDPKFTHFAFGDINHAYVAGTGGLWQAQLKAQGSASSEDNDGGDATAPKPGMNVVLTQLAADKIMLNGVADKDSDLKENISHLALYGRDMLPAAIVKDDDGAKEPDKSIKIFAALDNAGTKFMTNKLNAAGDDIDDAGKLYDAAQTFNAANIIPDAKPINQPIVAMAASRNQDRFFVAVADGSGVDRKLYKRPDDWEKMARDAIIAGIGGVKQNGGGAFVGGSNEEKFLQLLTPDQAPAPNGIVDATVKPFRDKFATGLTASITNAIYRSDLDFDTKNIHEEFSKLAFRDAINLRKGGLLDLGLAIVHGKDVGGGKIALNAAASLPGINDFNGIAGQAKPTQAAPDFNSPINNNNENLLAGAIQTALGWGIHELMKNTQEVYLDLDASKPFTSLDSRRVKDDKDAVTDLNIYVADQDGLARGICVIEKNGNDPELITKKGADFIVNPGKIVTTAMYDGIKFNEKEALAKNFGKLEQVGIPCAVYSAADPYPASRAMITGNVEMCWDDSLRRLFVGFEDITLGDDAGYLTNGSGGVCSVMVGREQAAAHPVNKRALYFQPLIGPNFSSLLFPKFLTPGAAALPAGVPGGGTKPQAAPSDYIVGFYQQHDSTKLLNAKAADDLHASAKKLRVMHTSTGKDYLLFNGGVAKQANWDGIKSKMYALPLIGSVNENLAAIPEAGLIAQAKRPAGVDFYKQGLDGVEFGSQNDAAGKPIGKVIGLVDAADADTGDLTKLQNKIATGYVKQLLADWQGTGVTQRGVQEAINLYNTMKDNPLILNSLASTALQATYATNTGAIPATTNDAADNAFTILNRAGYDKADPSQINKSQIFEHIESAALDLAVAAAAADRAKTEAPTYDMARYINVDKLKDCADNGRGDTTAVWNNGVVKNDYPKAFGDAGNLDIGNNAGTMKGAAAGGIAGGVAGIQGGIGWSIKNIMHNPGGGSIQEKKLLPAIATMHADAAPYPAFDYVRVGADPKRLSYDTSELVQDVWVVGDTVYVSLGGERDKKHLHDAGVFSSTAIFHQDGFIRSWTPWQRVQGHRDPVAGAVLDHTTSRFWNTTIKDAKSIDKPEELDTVRVTSWGRGFQADSAADGRLSTVLENVFGDLGGIYGLYSFSPETQGFKEFNAASAIPAERHEQFSMTVATGNGRVALIKTGKFNATTGLFEPTPSYSTTEKKNVFVFDAGTPNQQGTALGQLGIITCAEVSRLPLQAMAPASRFGWLFVGGTGGLAVLTRWFNGKGWNTGVGEGLSELLPGEQRDDFPGGSGWRWMQILIREGGVNKNPFKDVRKIVSDGSRYLYVMTPTEIWRLDMTSNAGIARTSRDYGIFKREASRPGTADRPDQNYTIILNRDEDAHRVTTTDSAEDAAGAGNIFANVNDKQFLDMLIGYRTTDGKPANTKTQLIVGTTAGLFYNDNAKFIQDRKVDGFFDIWTPLKVTAVTAGGGAANPPLGPVMRMEFTSSQPGAKMKKALNPVKEAQSYADGNLLVTAFDENKKYLANYRFNLSAADWNNPAELAINPFKEPYHLDGDAKETTPYFYKIGTLNDGEQDKVEFMGPFDYFARSAHTAGSNEGFAEGLWMMPEPAQFLRDEATGQFEDIDLGLDLTLPLYFGNIQLEAASGSAVIPGEWGIRVND